MKVSGIISFFLVLSGVQAIAQTGIGTRSPHPSAVLDISATNKGLKLPVVSLTSVNDGITVPAPAEGLVVYNNSTAGTGRTAVSKGLYQYTGTKWEKVFSKNETHAEIRKVPFLRPMFVGHRIESGTPVTQANATTVTMTFNELDYNYNNGATGATPDYNGYTIQEDGYYILNFSCDLQNVSGNNHGDQVVLVNRNGMRVAGRGINRMFQYGGVCNLCVLELSAGDHIEFRVYSNGSDYRIYSLFASIFKVY